MSEVIDTIEIAPDIHWVGKRDAASIFHSNPYLRVFTGKDGSQLSLLIDPGSSSDFAVVQSKVQRVIGDMSRISAVFVNHQDPDVGSSAARILGRHAPRAKLICSEETWRLIVHTAIPKGRLIATNDYEKRRIHLGTGHELALVPSPFCHFRGAVMVYDVEHRVLFTGDLFGGLTTTERDSGLWATEADWGGIRAFHQLYMPTNRAIARTMEAILRLDPPVEIIAPQHGRVLRGHLVQEFIERLAGLPVGLDIMDEDENTREAWNAVLDRVLENARMLLGSHAETKLVDRRTLEDTISFESGQPRITALGRWTLSEVVAALTADEPPEIANPIKHEAMVAAEDFDLPTPMLTLEEGASPSHGDDFVAFG